MRITIASGKGGTGKTTVAVNLAAVLKSRVQLLDCDVEAPNAHLFLNPTFQTVKTVSTPIPEIDEEKCTYCKKCAQICRFRAIAVVGETVLTFPELCHSCGGCLAVCPEDAVREVGRELGVIEIGQADGIAFAHGRLRVGEAMSPPLIRQVRALADPDKHTLIDAPPGTSCPVIAAMHGVDFVLLVTEPTPFGLHDLELAVGAVRLLGIPHGLVVNRSDLGDEGVATYARREEIPVLLEIPYDRRIAEAYAKGATIVDTFPEWEAKFKILFERIECSVAGGEGIQ
jgi:MinD superfamily P-loop ATPase